jgi:putative acetyltransferase
MVPRIRPEVLADRAAIRRLHLESFPTAAEADLVDALRDEGDAVLSLVAQEGTAVIGHVLFSRMTAPFRALGLAPVAVQSSHRRQGIAAHLVETGLAQAAMQGWQAVFVLGDATYYARFGFDAAKAAGFGNAFAGPHFMVKPLEALPVMAGTVEYAAAFARLG